MPGTLLPQRLCTGSSRSWLPLLRIRASLPHVLKSLLSYNLLGDHISLFPSKTYSPSTLAVPIFIYLFF